MPLLEVQHLQKVYTTRFGGNQVEALRNVNFSVESGEYVAIMGESGSGKTTLLNILAALDRPTAGEVYLNGKALSDIRERDLAAFRRSHLGFVFQDFNLLELFGEINGEGQTILMVTHSVKAASHAGRVLFLRDGQVYHQLYRGGETQESQFRRISDTLTVLAQGGESHA